jgi:hypothetical protein
MTDLLKLILGLLASLFRSRVKLEVENLILRQQINVLRRRMPKRPDLNNTDRILFVWLYRWFPCVLGAVAIVRPETIIRWHRAGFRAYWRWRSRNHVGRPKVSTELRTLIDEMSRANPGQKIGPRLNSLFWRENSLFRMRFLVGTGPCLGIRSETIR